MGSGWPGPQHWAIVQMDDYTLIRTYIRTCTYTSWQLVVAYGRNVGNHCKNQLKLKVAQGRLRGRVGIRSPFIKKPYKTNGKTAFPAMLQIQAPVGGCRRPRSWTGNPRRPLEKPWLNSGFPQLPREHSGRGDETPLDSWIRVTVYQKETYKTNGKQHSLLCCKRM